MEDVANSPQSYRSPRVGIARSTDGLSVAELTSEPIAYPLDSSRAQSARRRAVLSKTPDFIELAGSVSVSEAKRGAQWDEVMRQARVERRR